MTPRLTENLGVRYEIHEVPRRAALSGYRPGGYEIHFRVTDRISGQVAEQKAAFRIRE